MIQIHHLIELTKDEMMLYYRYNVQCQTKFISVFYLESYITLHIQMKRLS